MVGPLCSISLSIKSVQRFTSKVYYLLVHVDQVLVTSSSCVMSTVIANIAPKMDSNSNNFTNKEIDALEQVSKHLDPHYVLNDVPREFLTRKISA